MSTFTITSLSFYIFLFFSLLVYYVIPGKWQWGWLLAASAAFLVISTGTRPLLFLAINAAVAYGSAMIFTKSANRRLRLPVLLLSLAVIAAQLFLLKYYRNMLVWIPASVRQALSLPRIRWAAPIGISYFSLSTISYILDVYWEKQQAERNPLRLLLYITYFPALVSGPIVNYPTQSKVLFTPHPFQYTETKHGFERVLWGLFKKLVIADRIATFTTQMFSTPAGQWQGFSLVAGVLLYAYQIYTDFSGCMDIVLGISQMFQISMPENFKRPFMSQNLSEFWRRWHITLGEWSKEYILYPLLKSRPFVSLGTMLRRRFGKKVGKTAPTYIGLMVLWLLIGIWHGGSGRYIFAAGIMPWFLLVGGQIAQPVFDWITKVLRVNKDCFSYRLFSALRTLGLMCVIWLFAVSLSIGDGFRQFGQLFAAFNPQVLFNKSLLELGLDVYDFAVLGVALVILIGVSAFQEKGFRIRAALDRQNLPFRWFVLLGLIAVVVIFGIHGPGYNPANFIYGGF